MLARTARTVLLAMLAIAAACTGDDAPSSEPTDDDSTTTLATIPSDPGTIELTIGETTYTADIANCIVDADTQTVDFVAIGEFANQPIRIEHNRGTGGRLGLFINPTNPLDNGDSSWIGQPEFEIDDATATADFEATNTSDSSIASTSAVVICER